MVVIGHYDVDATFGGQVDLRGAAGPAVRGHDQRPSLGRRTVDRPKRKPVPVAKPLRHVRRDIEPDPPESEDQDGEAGQAVGVEIAIHEDAFTAFPRQAHALEGGGGIGEQTGIVEPFLGRRKEALEFVGAAHAASRQHRQQPLGDATFGTESSASGVQRDMRRQTPTEARIDHALQHATAPLRATYLKLNAAEAAERRARRSREPQRAHPRVRERGAQKPTKECAGRRRAKRWRVVRRGELPTSPPCGDPPTAATRPAAGSR